MRGPHRGQPPRFMSYEAPLAALRVTAPSERHTGWDLMGRSGLPWASLQSALPPHVGADVLLRLQAAGKDCAHLEGRLG